MKQIPEQKIECLLLAIQHMRLNDKLSYDESLFALKLLAGEHVGITTNNIKEMSLIMTKVEDYIVDRAMENMDEDTTKESLKKLPPRGRTERILRALLTLKHGVLSIIKH